MKKTIWMVFIALFAMSSCNDDALIEQTVAGNSVIEASFERGNESRVAVGIDNMLKWSSGDQFVVLSEMGAGCYTLSSEEGNTTGTFTGTLPSGTIKGAAYPYVDATTIPTLSGNTLTMTMPAEISFEEGVCDAPMWASITSGDVNSISFKHLVSMLKVDLSGIPATAGQLIVDASAPIAGKFTADITKTGNELILAASTGATNSITVNFTPSSSASQRLFLIPIPVGTYTSFALSYANADGSGKTFLKSWSNLEFSRAIPNKATIVIGNIDADLNSDVVQNGNTYTIKTVDGLFWFAEQVNGGNDFADKTVELGGDINLNNVAWTPIGYQYKENNKTKTRSFKGVFDGKDMTISNLNVSLTDGAAGLFGAVQNCLEIKNVKLRNVNIVSNHYAGALVGFFQENGSQRGNPKISNCSATDVTIQVIATEDDFGDKAGAIIGYAASDVDIKNCSVTNASITGYRDLGGIVGMANTSSAGTVTISDCTTSNVSIVQDLVHNYEDKIPVTLGDVYGRGTAIDENNNANQADITVKVYTQKDAQDALDAANTPRTITLAAGDYGKLYLRWNDASELLDDSSSPWAGGGHTYKRTIRGLAIQGLEGAKVTSLNAESATYAATEHSLSSIHAYLRLYMDIQNMKIEGIEFSPEEGATAIKLANAGQHIAIDGLTIEDCEVNGTNCTIDAGNRLFISEITEVITEFGLDRVRKNITIKDCTMNALHQGVKINYAENLTISGNNFNNVKGRDMLLGTTGNGLIGTINITSNTSDGATERFIRMTNLKGNLSVVNNVVTNYSGADTDMVKISNIDSSASIAFSGNTWMGSNDNDAKLDGKVSY